MSKVRYFGHSLLWLCTVSLVVIAIFFTVTRIAISTASSYKVNVEQLLSHQLGEQVTIEDFSASYEGFKPQLKLDGVKLIFADKNLPPLSIGQIKFSFDFSTILLGRLTPGKIVLSDTKLSIKRFQDGHISIIGLQQSVEQERVAGDFSWLLDDGTFEIINSHLVWEDELKNLPDLELEHGNMLLQNRGASHTLSLQAVLPELSEQPIKFIVSVTGDVLSSSNWSAEGYLKAERVNLLAIVKRLHIAPFDVKNGFADLEIWSRWKQAEVAQIKGRISVENSSVLYEKAVFEVKESSSWFAWNKLSKGWSLSLGDLSFQIDDMTQTKSQAYVEYIPNDANDFSTAFKSTGFNVNVLASVLGQSAVLDLTQKNTLQRLNPKGRVEYVNAKLRRFNDQYEWAVCGKLREFSSQAMDPIPETSNISGSICSTNAEGWGQLETSSASIDLKELFSEPFQLDGLHGLMTWKQLDESWDISSDHLYISTPHIQAESRLRLNLAAGEERPYIDIQMNLGSAQAKYVPLYLPLEIMHEEVANWLKDAFKGGRLLQGGLLMRGELAAFPYRDNEGVFQFLGDAEGVDLHYADQWPDVKCANATVELKNQGLTIAATKASIAGNHIKSAVITVADRVRSSHLEVTGHIDDELAGLYEFFKQSPINDSVKALTQRSRVEGPVSLDLDLKIALKPGIESSVKARASLAQNKFTLPDLNLSLDNLNGDIRYSSDKGLTAKSLRASFLNEATAIAIENVKESTLISLVGDVSMRSLEKKYPADIWQKVSGKTSANLDVLIPFRALSGSATTTVKLKTNLMGVEVDLPAPIGKAKGVTHDLNILASIKPDALPVEFSYADKLQGSFLFKETVSDGFLLDRGDVHVGKAKASLPKTAGVKLSGVIPTLDIELWKKALTINQQTSSSSLLNQLDINIGELRWSQTTFNKLQIKGKHQQSAWLGQIDSPVISGQYVLPDSFGAGSAIKLNLNTLKLPTLDAIEVNNNATQLSPDDIPDIDLSSQNLFIGESNLGVLDLQLRQKEKGLIIQKLSLNSSRDEFQANGAWEKDGASSRTGINGKLISKSLGGLIKDSGISSNVEGMPADIYFDLHWPGDPQSFSKKHLSGFADVKSEEGRLLDVEPGIGRIFGLLSLSTLQRRLQLDFSDLVEKGLGFDKIKGHFVATDGEVETNRFYLESPSTRLDFEGRVSLAKEELDQLITVTPKTTEGLPLAGALAGGPLVGAAVFLVQKIAGKTVNKFAGYQYHVTGPWKDPEIKQLSQPGGKIFGFMDGFLSPVYDATIGQLPLNNTSAKEPSADHDKY
tara:strand:- start:60351 stop:64259 length:3909 start_codon:yes stop_codon:yes gene_type:complete